MCPFLSAEVPPGWPHAEPSISDRVENRTQHPGGRAVSHWLWGPATSSLVCLLLNIDPVRKWQTEQLAMGSWTVPGGDPTASLRRCPPDV